MKTPSRFDVRAMLAALAWPAPGPAYWRDVTDAATTPGARLDVFRRLQRHLLVSTETGRRRLRAWLDSHQDQVPETLSGRRARLVRDLKFYGDIGLLVLVCDVIARLPRPVIDMVLSECMVIVTGRSSHGWTSGRFPALRPIVISGAPMIGTTRRTDDDIAATVRHEVGHRWALEHVCETRPAYEQEVARAELATQMPPGIADTLDKQHECDAWWLAWAWTPGR